MTDDTLNTMVLNLPNFAGLIIALYVLYKYCRREEE